MEVCVWLFEELEEGVFSRSDHFIGGVNEDELVGSVLGFGKFETGIDLVFDDIAFFVGGDGEDAVWAGPERFRHGKNTEAREFGDLVDVGGVVKKHFEVEFEIWLMNLWRRC